MGCNTGLVYELYHAGYGQLIYRSPMVSPSLSALSKLLAVLLRQLRQVTPVAFSLEFNKPHGEPYIRWLEQLWRTSSWRQSFQDQWTSFLRTFRISTCYQWNCLYCLDMSHLGGPGERHFGMSPYSNLTLQGNVCLPEDWTTMSWHLLSIGSILPATSGYWYYQVGSLGKVTKSACFKTQLSTLKNPRVHPLKLIDKSLHIHVLLVLGRSWLLLTCEFIQSRINPGPRKTNLVMPGISPTRQQDVHPTKKKGGLLWTSQSSNTRYRRARFCPQRWGTARSPGTGSGCPCTSGSPWTPGTNGQLYNRCEWMACKKNVGNWSNLWWQLGEIALWDMGVG